MIRFSLLPPSKPTNYTNVIWNSNLSINLVTSVIQSIHEIIILNRIEIFESIDWIYKLLIENIYFICVVFVLCYCFLVDYFSWCCFNIHITVIVSQQSFAQSFKQYKSIALIEHFFRLFSAKIFRMHGIFEFAVVCAGKHSKAIEGINWQNSTTQTKKRRGVCVFVGMCREAYTIRENIKKNGKKYTNQYGLSG